MLLDRKEDTVLKITSFRAFFVILLGFVLATPENAAAKGPRPRLEFVQALNLPGSFPGSQSIWAGKDRIFVASFQGDLFILRILRDGKVYLENTLHLSNQPLTAVAAEHARVYVVGLSGDLWIFYEGTIYSQPKLLHGPVHLSDFGLSNVAAAGGKAYVAKGQAAMVADHLRVYLAPLNPGDVALEVTRHGTLSGKVFGETYVPGATVVFDRLSGRQLGIVANPGTPALYVDRRNFLQTLPGCCGPGVYSYNNRTLALDRVYPTPSTNTALVGWFNGKNYLIVGTEAGEVQIYDLATGHFCAGINLRTLLGHTGPEDIEIRSLAYAGGSGLIYAVSNWNGNPNIPSFFVLKLVR